MQQNFLPSNEDKELANREKFLQMKFTRSLFPFIFFEHKDIKHTQLDISDDQTALNRMLVTKSAYVQQSAPVTNQTSTIKRKKTL